jgi:hypothetical protein
LLNDRDLTEIEYNVSKAQSVFLLRLDIGYMLTSDGRSSVEVPLLIIEADPVSEAICSSFL